MISLTQVVYDSIVAHARREAPREACGLLSGVDAITEIQELQNVEQESPETRYVLDPTEQFTAFRRLQDSNQKLLGIYHSHPASPAYPSATDIRLAFYPEAVYFICSLAEAEPVLRAFRIVEGEISEVEIEIQL